MISMSFGAVWMFRKTNWFLMEKTLFWSMSTSWQNVRCETCRPIYSFVLSFQLRSSRRPNTAIAWRPCKWQWPCWLKRATSLMCRPSRKTLSTKRTERGAKSTALSLLVLQKSSTTKTKGRSRWVFQRISLLMCLIVQDQLSAEEDLYTVNQPPSTRDQQEAHSFRDRCLQTITAIASKASRSYKTIHLYRSQLYCYVDY